MSDTETISEAIVAALSELATIEPKRTANAGSYKYKYADISDLVALTRPVLAAHGLVALTPVHEHGTGLACSVELLHRSGESFRFLPLPFLPGKDPQTTGSAITYHRRYALLAALGMAAGGDDDDGARARFVPPEPSWTATRVKAQLVELLNGDKGSAKDAWILGHGDEISEYGPMTAERLAADWVATQELEPDEDGTEA